MTTLIETNIHKVVSGLSSDPIKQLVAERLLHNLSSTLNSISMNDAKQLLKLADVDFYLQVGNTLAEKQIGLDHDTVSKKSIKENKKIQQFIATLKEHGGSYTSKELETKLNITKAAITNRKNRNTLFSIKVGGRVYFPKLQFTDNMNITKPFKDILQILEGKDPIACFFFLLEKAENHQDQDDYIYKILKDSNQKRYIYSNLERRAKILHSL